MIRLAVVFGGMSSEHDVSCVSAKTVIDALDRTKYEVTCIGITKDGKWYLVEDEDTISNREWEKNEELAKAVISPATDHKIIINSKSDYREKEIDVVFPVLHGLYGEDGTIQGLLEMAKLPYVGCGTLSSAITMDKFFTKVIADSVGVVQTPYVGVRSYELSDMEKLVEKIEKERVYPMFVKPSCAGSSIGITKAHNRDELISGLKLAAQHDSKILVEETINGREIECAVYGAGDTAIVGGLGEIVAGAEFYDFDAKYNDEGSLTITNPDISEEKKAEIKEKALKIYGACDCYGLSRVDFFLERGSDRVVFNEINAIPGHTSISMYPMLMEEAGYPMSQYIDGLIEMAFNRKKY
ncbi:MAG: D-alanine--D-alanine ligase [Eubacterium sp.]|nr:D-alanine--D-alanine ligase [Eubacterium sp.]